MWYFDNVAELNLTIQEQAKQHQAILTKPAGSLGMLEEIAIQFSAMQSSTSPKIDNCYIAVFAADHGVVEENISAFPQAVTAEMVRNFSRGGAAISVLAKQIEAELVVINAGTATELEPLPGVEDKRIANGTCNFTKQKAMTSEQCEAALLVGKAIAEQAMSSKADIFIGGEMGIGNTTSSSALACALLNKDALTLVGPGTGLTPDGITHKAKVIQQALSLHSNCKDPVAILESLGGFEIVTLVGAYMRAAQLGLPCIIDGFITSVAALFASKINPGSAHWFVYSHQSAEPGHKIILDALNAQPLLNIGMRLGEGSAAANIVCLLKNALSLHNNMATFEQAGVSEKS